MLMDVQHFCFLFESCPLLKKKKEKETFAMLRCHMLLPQIRYITLISFCVLLCSFSSVLLLIMSMSGENIGKEE